MKPIPALLLCALLSACASAPQPRPALPALLLQDQLFAPSGEAPNAERVFALSSAMRHYADTELGSLSSARDPRRLLIDALYRRGQLRLTYDAGATRDAAEAFDARAGNCLSLVIMTAAFAKHLGLPVTFQSVSTEETFNRVGDLFLVSGHVNLVLEKAAWASRLGEPGSHALTVDFLPAEQLRGQRVRPIDEATIVAMFMNNRAAEALSDGRVHDSYWWAREALHQDPGFLAGINTLAVIYLRQGHLREAELALRHVLSLQPQNTHALANLVHLLERAGRTGEAQQLAEQLAQLEPHPPFYYFNLGRAALDAGDLATARALLASELQLQPDQHEVHFWLAVVHWRLGDHERAVRHMRLALENSTTRRTHDLYAAKLARLRAEPLP